MKSKQPSSKKQPRPQSQPRFKGQPHFKERSKVAKRVDFLDKLEKRLAKRRLLYLLLCLATALVFSLLCFNVRISEAFDDALYIEAGYRYAAGFFSYYYTSTAPLYCMFLALPIAIFGLNLIMLKSFSVLFFVLGILFLYLAFKGKVRYAILFPALFLTALNTLFIGMASLTYTEPFVLMLSGLLFMAWFKLDDATDGGANLRKNWQRFLLLGLMAFLLYFSRNVAAVIFAVVFAYFLLYKKYLTAVYALASSLLFMLLHQKVVMPLCWGHLNLGGRFASQGRIMLQKDAYNPGMGQEDFAGMVTRFFENAKIYASQLFELVCLKSDASPKSYLFFAALLLLAGLGVGYAVAKRQRHVMAAALYVVTFLAATFISLHTFWSQSRLIMIYIPLIAVVALYGLAALLKHKRVGWLQWSYLAGVLLLLAVNLNNAVEASKKNLPALRKNLAGNKYYGFTPDWVNYFRMSEWAAENLDKDKVVACRKAPMSFVYTQGRAFRGISSVPTVEVDSALRASNYRHGFIGVPSAGMFQHTFQALQPYMVAVLLCDKASPYFAYDVSEPAYSLYADDMKRSGTTFYTAPEELSNAIKQLGGVSFGAYPDSLLKSLKDSNTSYVINASLRANSAQKTNNTISTITRYMGYVEQKYPGAFRKIHQIGGDDNEPAMIYEVHYPENFEGNATP
jgi:hypothetical protein